MICLLLMIDTGLYEIIPGFFACPLIAIIASLTSPTFQGEGERRCSTAPPDARDRTFPSGANPLQEMDFITKALNSANTGDKARETVL